MKLIPNWRHGWRYFSVIAATALAVLSVLQSEVLPLFQFAVPPQMWPWVSVAFSVLIVVLRLVAQDTPKGPS